MVAVFGLQRDFEVYVKEHADSKELIKRVTDNIKVEFADYSVERVVFLPGFWRGYHNLMKLYVETKSYVRGSKGYEATATLEKMIEIERTIMNIRDAMTKVATMEG